MGIVLACILAANGPHPPYYAPCNSAEFTVARCTKATAEQWDRLKALELDWIRVDRNTHCLRVK